MTNFDPFSIAKSILPQTIGFDRVFNEIENAQKLIQKTVRNYPPYNIKKVSDNRYVLELAVAGFGKHDIDIEMQDGILTIKGITSLDNALKDGVDATYLYKGIADSAFTRQFTVADTVEIKNAELLNGMLKIWLENIIPDSKKPKKIVIDDEKNTKDESSTSQFLSEKYGDK